MDGASIVQYGLDLLNLMTMDPEGIWDALSMHERVRVGAELQHFRKIAQTIMDDTEQDSEKSQRDLVALATAVKQLVYENPALCDLLLPPDTSNHDAHPVLTAWKIDLGAPENEQRAKAQKYAAQMHNSLVIIQQARPVLDDKDNTQDNKNGKKNHE